MGVFKGILTFHRFSRQKFLVVLAIICIATHGGGIDIERMLSNYVLFECLVGGSALSPEHFGCLAPEVAMLATSLCCVACALWKLQWILVNPNVINLNPC